MTTRAWWQLPKDEAEDGLGSSASWSWPGYSFLSSWSSLASISGLRFGVGGNECGVGAGICQWAGRCLANDTAVEHCRGREHEAHARWRSGERVGCGAGARGVGECCPQRGETREACAADWNQSEAE
jgi:hypothetical protein